jgi:hypothetical protein
VTHPPTRISPARTPTRITPARTPTRITPTRTPGRSTGARGAPPPGTRGQASVELALVLPVVVLLLLLAVQAGLLARDRVLGVHAARAAARAVVVDPREAAARAALQHQGGAAAQATVQLQGDRRPGGFVTVVVTLAPTRLPIVGRVLGGFEVRERLVVLVEGPA